MGLTSSVSHLSGVTVLHGLMSSVLKIIVLYIFSVFLSCFRWEGIDNPYHPEAEVLLGYIFVLHITLYMLDIAIHMY